MVKLKARSECPGLGPVIMIKKRSSTSNLHPTHLLYVSLNIIYTYVCAGKFSIPIQAIYIYRATDAAAEMCEMSMLHIDSQHVTGPDDLSGNEQAEIYSS